MAVQLPCRVRLEHKEQRVRFGERYFYRMFFSVMGQEETRKTLVKVCVVRVRVAFFLLTPQYPVVKLVCVSVFLGSPCAIS